MYISIDVRMDEYIYYSNMSDLNLLQLQNSRAELNSLEKSKRVVPSKYNKSDLNVFSLYQITDLSNFNFSPCLRPSEL